MAREALERVAPRGDVIMDVLSITGYNRRPPHLVAEYKGFFAKENLEVRFHETTYYYCVINVYSRPRSADIDRIG